MSLPYQSSAEYSQLVRVVQSNKLADVHAAVARVLQGSDHGMDAATVRVLQSVDREALGAFVERRVMRSRAISYEFSAEETEECVVPLAVLFDPRKKLIGWASGREGSGRDVETLGEFMREMMRRKRKCQWAVFDGVERKLLVRAMKGEKKWEELFRGVFGREVENMEGGGMPGELEVETLVCPVVGVVHKLIRTVVAMPVEGFFDIYDCGRLLLEERMGHYELVALSLNDIYELWARKHEEYAMERLQYRSVVVKELLKATIRVNRENVRGRLGYHKMKDEGAIMSSSSLLLLRRMQFVKQSEVLLACETLRDDRARGRGDVVQMKVVKQVGRLVECEVVSGREFLPIVEERTSSSSPRLKLFDKIVTFNDGVRAETTFEDLAFRTKIRPEDLVRTVEGVMVGNVEKVDGKTVHVELCKHRVMAAGTQLKMRDRYVDLNMSKWSSVYEKFETTGQFARIISRPHDWNAIAAEPRFVGLDEDVIGLDGSQEDVWRHVAQNRLTVLWGPPGSGKTYCLSAVVMRSMMAVRESKSFRVLITAFTHAALSAFMGQFERRREEVAGRVDVEVVELKEVKSHADLEKMMRRQERCVYVGTLWSIAKVCYGTSRKACFDMVVIDEASQMLVSDSGIALDCVKPRGRVVIAGDHLQLQPLLQTTYPEPRKEDEAMVATGVMQCLLRDERNRRVEYGRSGVDLQACVGYVRR